MSNYSILSSIPAGQTVQMARINAGRRLKHRLTELGLTPGVKVTIIQNNGGPILISVRDSRIAIGREMANKIQVILINEKLFIPNQSASILPNQNVNENTPDRRRDRHPAPFSFLGEATLERNHQSGTRWTVQ